MSNRMWENTVEHAKTCVLGGKLYVYYTDETNSTGVVFNHIYELRGLIADGQFVTVETLDHNQKVSDLLPGRKMTIHTCFHVNYLMFSRLSNCSTDVGVAHRCLLIP